jgi:hypothetical protein
VESNPQYGKEINKKLTDIVNENDLTQIVREPTRGNNIIDLMLTTNHGLISSVEVHPGMSDHNVIITDVNLQTKSAKTKPHRVLLYRKADTDRLNTFIKDKLSEKTRGSHISSADDSENWNYLKRTITEAISKFVPQTTLGGKQHVPWKTTHIKRLIRRRQRRYNAKKHNTNKNWKKKKIQRDEKLSKKNHEHDNYVRQILNHDEDSKNYSLSKNFWKYIKSRKKDIMGISPLQNVSGEYIIDNKGKVEILNKQYDSVFTDENLEQTQQLGNSSVPSIDQLNITENGVCTFLKKLDPTKANGPDQIPTRILKEAYNEIAPFLTIILRQSLITGELFEDWRQANITAI